MAQSPRHSEIRRIGRQLRLLRERAGRTVAQLAEAAGISERALRELEQGRTNPSLSTVVGVVDALGVGLDEVVAAARLDVPATFTSARPAGSAALDLSAGLPRPRMQARLVEVRQGDAGDLPSGAVFGHLLGGSAHVTLDADEVMLRPGDSFHAQAGVLRAWSNGEGGGRLLVVEAVAPGEDDA